MIAPKTSLEYSRRTLALYLHELIFAIGFVTSATVVIAVSVESKLQRWLKYKDYVSETFAL
jgi:hypothetical protein